MGGHETMTEILREIIFDNLNLDAIRDWCEDFAHWYFVQEELEDIGVHYPEIDNHVNGALLQLKQELDKLEYGEPETVEEFEKRMKK